ncbi:MAG TPA: uroporphyrinogen-III C-methyltransferase [Burkholderiaceae bacterium]|nr:uroporphyrinogen-III C-methyltransferase [Burkholderiaceae bacterium]
MTDQKPNTPADAPKKKAASKSRNAQPAARKAAAAEQRAQDSTAVDGNQKNTAKRTASAKKSTAAAGKSAASRATPEKTKPDTGSVPPPRTSGAGMAGSEQEPAGKSSGRFTTAVLWLLFILILVLAAGGVYLFNNMQTSSQSLSQFQSTQEEALDQARQFSEQAQKQAADAADVLSKQEAMLDDQADDIAALQKSLADTQAELQDLGQAYQRLTDRGNDLVLLNDIENLVTIAQQQLRLSGNVANAIMSLETAQAQLARASRPTMASLQQTINGDLDRLRTAQVVDVAAISVQLDELADLVARAPLLVPDDAMPRIKSGLASDNADDTPSAADQDPDAAEAPSSEAPDASADEFSANPDDKNWWQRVLDQVGSWAGNAASTLRTDIDRFVSVRRVDDSTALFISPDQASRFRDHLRLRIMTAQMALATGRENVWETETQALQQAIEGRFDETSSHSRKAVKLARDLADTSIIVKLPTVDNSIKALESLRQSGSEDADDESADSDNTVAESAE